MQLDQGTDGELDDGACEAEVVEIEAEEGGCEQQDVHLMLAGSSPLLQQPHRVVLQLLFPRQVLPLQLLLCSFQSLKIPGCSSLKNIVAAFRIRPETDFRNTSSAFDVEPVNPKTKVIHVIHILFSSVEFSPLVDIFSAGGASHVTRSHHTDDESGVSATSTFWNLCRIKIWRIVFVQHFSLSHLVFLSNTLLRSVIKLGKL